MKILIPEEVRFFLVVGYFLKQMQRLHMGLYVAQTGLYLKLLLIHFRPVKMREKRSMVLISIFLFMQVGQEAEMKKLPSEVRRIIVSDESLKNGSSAFLLAAEPQACGIFNIKLMKCEGLLGAFEIAAIAQASDVKLIWGCYDEDIVSISPALHAAFACPATCYLDLDGSLQLTEDTVTGGFAHVNGELSPLNVPGFGCKEI